MTREMPEGLIRGSDLDRQAVAAARGNLREIPGTRGVAVERKDFRELPGIPGATIVCNPPYGIRVGEVQGTRLLYKEFGDFLKQRCPGSTAYVLCGNLDLVAAIGLKPARRFVLFNGPIECRLLKIEIYLRAPSLFRAGCAGSCGAPFRPGTGSAAPGR